MARESSSPRARRIRLARLFLAILGAAFVGMIALTVWDPMTLVESFQEQAAERRFLAVWSRRAAPVTWEECRVQPDLCPGKIVVWRVSRPTKNRTFCAGSPGQVIRWSNEDQVPVTGARGSSVVVVGKVLTVNPDHIELVFLGTPNAPYGGTTSRDVPARPARKTLPAPGRNQQRSP